MDERSTRRSALPSVWPYPRSNGSITTLAWNGDVLCTSMMRGFKKALLCMRKSLKRNPGKPLAPWGKKTRRLLRVKLDDETFVDVLTEFGTVRRTLERTGQLFHVDTYP